jgi:hypothetical protein
MKRALISPTSGETTPTTTTGGIEDDGNKNEAPPPGKRQKNTLNLDVPSDLCESNTVATAAVKRLSEPTERNLVLKEAELREITGDVVNRKTAKDDDKNNDKNDAAMFNSGHKPPKQPVPDDEAHAALRAKCKAKIKKCAELRARRPDAP